METKVLLRLIKDDIKLLDEINGSFISSEMLTNDEVEVALTRARGLVMEFEMLSKNITQIHEDSNRPEVKVKHNVEEKAVTVSKEPEVLKSEPELINPGKENVTKPVILKADSKPNPENNPVMEKEVQKEKATKAVKDEEPAEILIKEALKTNASPADQSKVGQNLGDKQPSVNELLSQERIETGFEGIPLKSIRDGIGLNDRYLFIRELFANDAEKYTGTINTLDQFGSIEEAVGYLKQNYKWNKTEAGQKFLALVKRRFSK